MDGFLVELSSPEQIRNNLEVNYLGPVNMIKAHTELLKKAQGRVVNISSIAGRFSIIGIGPYCGMRLFPSFPMSLDSIMWSHSLQTRP